MSQSERNQEIQKTIATLSADPEMFYKQVKEMFPEPSDMEPTREMGDVVGPSNVAEGSGVDKGTSIA